MRDRLAEQDPSLALAAIVDGYVLHSRDRLIEYRYVILEKWPDDGHKQLAISWCEILLVDG